MTELTRFDFHVNRFLNSKDVKVMSASEVGQYILLLCEAWVLGQDATLPSDENYLARVARVDKVSPLVMKKFQLVETERGQEYLQELIKQYLAARAPKHD